VAEPTPAPVVAPAPATDGGAESVDETPLLEVAPQDGKGANSADGKAAERSER
jgi:hypothetical protein